MKLKHQTIFYIVAILLIVFTLGLLVYLTIFLISQLSSVSGEQAISQPPIQGFDIEGFEKLNLIKTK